MTKAAAIECARLGYGIRVNSVHPGFVETEMYQDIMRRYVELGMFPDVAAAEALVRQTHPLGFGQPVDVANTVLFLATDESRWTTGAEMVVDGGLHAS
jgi:NAD(P)-dependent dehydrogenase (short-subunit alcohol dehydrogenase family)